MLKWEREIIRDLAKKKLEISQLPIMSVREERWRKHNDSEGEIPMIHFEVRSIKDDGFNYKCKCTSEDAIAIERPLGNSLTNHFMVDDDRVVTNDFVCNFKSSFIPFGIEIVKQKTEGVGFHIEPQINDLYDLTPFGHSKMTFDYEGSIKWKEFVEETIGDILNVRMGMGALYSCPTSDILHIMGMENMFIAMYDTPDEFHCIMNKLAQDYIEYFNELEKRKMLCQNNYNDTLFQGSFGFSNQFGNTNGDVTTKDCWGYMDSQETVGISQDMFDEFIFPYYKMIADRYGRLSYGCCEPVSAFWEKSISRFENLRKISISPWCDEQYMGERLKGTGIIYQRKPSPNYVGLGAELDEDAFRSHIKNTLNCAKGCKLEFSFRDTYNLDGRMNKPRRAVEIVREEIENCW